MRERGVEHWWTVCRTLGGRTYRRVRRPDGGAMAFADPDPDPESGPTPPTRQGRAAESAQDARVGNDEAPSTFEDAPPHRPARALTRRERKATNLTLLGRPGWLHDAALGGVVARRSTAGAGGMFIIGTGEPSARA